MPQAQLIFPLRTPPCDIFLFKKVQRLCHPCVHCHHIEISYECNELSNICVYFEIPPCPVAYATSCIVETAKGTKQYRLDENPWPQSGVTPWLSGLPKLPESHAPNSEHWSNSIAICAIMKDENITDVAEWVSYHKCAPASV